MGNMLCKKKTGSGPPPPPKNKAPPPPVGKAPPPAAGGGGMGAVFKEIGAHGDDITKMLKHVTDEEKTYKQPRGEAKPLNTTTLDKLKAGKTNKWSGPSQGTKDLSLKGNTWTVAYHGTWTGDVEKREFVTLEKLKKGENVHILNCNMAYITLPVKPGTVTMEGCLDTMVQFSAGADLLELKSCETTEVKFDDTVPKVTITDSKIAKFHLVKDLNTKFTTTRAQNVVMTYLFTDEFGDQDTETLAIRDQFLTKIVGNALKTTPFEGMES